MKAVILTYSNLKFVRVSVRLSSSRRRVSGCSENIPADIQPFCIFNYLYQLSMSSLRQNLIVAGIVLGPPLVLYYIEPFPHD